MTRPRRIGLALERESVFARQVLQGMAAAVPELERSGFPVDLRFLPDRLVRDAADLRGFDGFVAKPIEMRELHRVIKKYIQSRAPEGYLEQVRKEQAAEKKEEKPEQAPHAPAPQPVKAAVIPDGAERG